MYSTALFHVARNQDVPPEIVYEPLVGRELGVFALQQDVLIRMRFDRKLRESGPCDAHRNQHQHGSSHRHSPVRYGHLENMARLASFACVPTLACRLFLPVSLPT